jgi:hypothetical protein
MWTTDNWKIIFNLDEEEDGDESKHSLIDTYTVSWIGTYQMGTSAQENQAGKSKTR